MRLKLLWSLLVVFTITLCASLHADPVIEAEAMISRHQYDSTITLLKARIEKDPSFADLYYLLGKAYYFKGEYAQAETELQNCLDRKRKHEDAQAYLALTYVAMKKWSEAKAILDEGTAKSKTSKGLFFDIMGKYYMARGEFTEADLAFRRAIIEEPNNIEYKRDLADLAFENKVYEIAIQGYREVLAIDSLDVITHYKLGKALYYQQKWAEAVKSLNNAIRLDSNYTDAYQLSGDIYMILGLAASSNGNGDVGESSNQASDLFKNAIWMYERMLKLGGKETLDVDYRLGQAYYNVNGFPLAVQYLDRAIANGSAKANAYSLKAKSLFRLKQYDQAEAAFTDYEKKVTKGDPNYQWSASDFDYFRERSLTYYQLFFEGRREGQTDSTLLEKAVPYYLKAIELRDTTDVRGAASLYDQLGLSYYYVGKYLEAIPWFEKKIAIDTVAVKTYQNIGNCYMKLNNPDKAMEYLNKVVQINPGACGVYQTMFSYFLVERKDKKEAHAVAQKWAQCDTVGYQPYKWLGYFAISDKPVRKDDAIEYLLKARKRMESLNLDPCKEIDIMVWLAQTYNMYDDGTPQKKQAVDWSKRGLKCDPKNETLKGIIEENE
jgi:tetratricopeptide (TPR) repeat protein